MNICIYIYVHLSLSIYIYVYIHVYIHVYVYACAYVYVCVHVYAYAFVCVYIDAHRSDHKRKNTYIYGATESIPVLLAWKHLLELVRTEPQTLNPKPYALKPEA